MFGSIPYLWPKCQCGNLESLPPITPMRKIVWSLQDAFGCANSSRNSENLKGYCLKQTGDVQTHVSQPGGFRVFHRINYLLGTCLGLRYSEGNCVWVWQHDIHLSQVWAHPSALISAASASHRLEQNLKYTLGAIADGFLPITKIKLIISTVPRHFFHSRMVIFSRPKYS